VFEQIPGMCGEDSLSSTNCLRLDKPKLFSFFASHSFSTVTLPTSAVKRSFCFCDLISYRNKKRTKYTSAFKTKLVLELLQNKSTLVQIASKHNILSQNLQNWKKTFLANAEIAMDKPKLFSFFASHSFSTVTLPASVVKRSFCFCDLISSSLYSLTVLEGKPSLLTLKLPWSPPRQLKNTKKSLLNHKSKTSV
jgi:transposase-like protein